MTGRDFDTECLEIWRLMSKLAVLCFISSNVLLCYQVTVVIMEIAFCAVAAMLRDHLRHGSDNSRRANRNDKTKCTAFDRIIFQGVPKQVFVASLRT